MNKKGDLSVEPIMIVALVVAFLALVGFGAYLHFSGKIEFFKGLPGFNLTTEKQEQIQIVGYDIGEDKVQYYTGVEWLEIPEDGVSFGKKKIEKDDLRRDLVEGYWYNLNLRNKDPIFSLEPFGNIYTSPREIAVKIPSLKLVIIYMVRGENFIPTTGGIFWSGIGNSITDKIADWVNWIFGDDTGAQRGRIAEYTKGSVVGLLLNRLDEQDSRVYGEFILNSDDSLKFSKVTKFKNEGNIERPILGDFANVLDDEVYEEIKREMISWRDSVLEKPVSVEGKWYCVQKIKGKLVVELNKEVGQNAKCEN